MLAYLLYILDNTLSNQLITERFDGSYSLTSDMLHQIGYHKDIWVLGSEYQEAISYIKDSNPYCSDLGSEFARTH